jgi:hypothetical protein
MFFNDWILHITRSLIYIYIPQDPGEPKNQNTEMSLSLHQYNKDVFWGILSQLVSFPSISSKVLGHYDGRKTVLRWICIENSS